MALFTFSSTLGQSLAFDPLNDVLLIDVGNASEITLSEEAGDLRVSRGGDQVVLISTQISDLSPINVTFSDGSVLAAGDAADNDLLGTASDDQLIGLDGNDVLTGGQGNDLLNGGDGTDTARYVDDEQNLKIDLQTGIAVESVITDELVELGEINPRGFQFRSKYADVAGQGDFAYLGGSNEIGIVVIDVSDPSNPVKATSFLKSTGEFFSDIKIDRKSVV